MPSSASATATASTSSCSTGLASAGDDDFPARRARGRRDDLHLRRLLTVAFDGMYFRTTVLLRLIVILGFAISLAGGVFAAYAIYARIAEDSPPGYTSIVVLLLLLSGFIIISLGVVGLYVGRIFDQVKGRPLFIVEEDRAMARRRGTDDAALALSAERRGPRTRAADPRLRGEALVVPRAPAHDRCGRSPAPRLPSHARSWTPDAAVGGTSSCCRGSAR